MIEMMTGVRPGQNALLEEAFRLRHRVFVEELHWELLRQPDCREIDQFDGPASIYLIATAAGRAVGNLRLTPTIRPHLLGSVHAHLAPRGYPRAPHVWEWTRYCIDPAHRGGSEFGRVASSLTIAAVEWGLAHGVHDVVVEYDPVWIPRFAGLGFQVRPLGLPVEMDGQPVVAVHMRYGAAALERLRKARGVRAPVLAALAGELRHGRGTGTVGHA